MKGLLFVGSLISLLICSIIMIVLSVRMNQDMGGYLARASHANTIEMAVSNLEPAIAYIEQHRLTDGYTSVLWRTPDEDIGYWYQNLKASITELQGISPDSSLLERTNVLMKLRETLTRDSGESGTSIVVPDGLSRYPSNTLFGFWFWLSFLLFAGTGIAFLVEY